MKPGPTSKSLLSSLTIHSQSCFMRCTRKIRPRDSLVLVLAPRLWRTTSQDRSCQMAIGSRFNLSSPVKRSTMTPLIPPNCHLNPARLRKIIRGLRTSLSVCKPNFNRCLQDLNRLARFNLNKLNQTCFRKSKISQRNINLRALTAVDR